MANPSFNNPMKVEVTTTEGHGPSVSFEKSDRPWSHRWAERLFRSALGLSVLVVMVVIVLILVSLVLYSLPAIHKTGWEFFTGENWDPANEQFGALPFIAGTLVTSSLALLLSFPFSLAMALFLGEYFPKGRIATFMTAVIELLAGIPSIIYGAFGLFVLVPLIQQWQLTMPGVIPLGVGVFTAALLLALMIIPYSASLSREVIALVPAELKEAVYALGGSRLAVIRFVILPYSFSGIFAGQLLAFGRALGETMAVAMVIGNMNIIPTDLFSPGSTIASVIANEFSEASGFHTAALTEIGLILFFITVAFSFIGRFMINRLSMRGTL